MKPSYSYIMFFMFMLLACTLYSQKGITLQHTNTPLKRVLNHLKSQTDYTFFYNLKEVDETQKITISSNEESITTILNKLSQAYNLYFIFKGKQIIINRKITDSSTISHHQIKGIITDSNNQPLIGANIIVKETSLGVQTDLDGSYILNIPRPYNKLVVSFIGFKTQIVTIQEQDKINVTLLETTALLDDISVLGSRNPNRTTMDTSVPVDVIDISIIAKKGAYTSVTEILNHIAPSFTSQTQTVSDETDHIDPASLRGLGPDQVLVLINGKRRHTTSIVNVNGTVGRGSVGTDMNFIPIIAIKRIEILRDGAAAQYGSDAIAGIINIVLKKGTEKLNLSISTGANFSKNSNQFEGGTDGEKIKIALNYGIPLGDNGGFINLSGAFITREPALRNKDNQNNIFRAYHGVERLFTANNANLEDMTLLDYQNTAAELTYLNQETKNNIANLDITTPEGISTLQTLLNFDADAHELPIRNLSRKDFRFKVGTSKLREGKFFANASIPINQKTEFYSFGGISYREGLASGFYRRPAQEDGRANTLAFPNGFLPNINSKITDKSLAIGIKTSFNDWKIDFSNTYGKNSFAIFVGNSSNSTLGTSTPRFFDAGGFKFTQNTINLDLNRYYTPILNGLNIAIGAEYKIESYEIINGEEASYASYDTNGAVVDKLTPDHLLVRHHFTGHQLVGGSQVYRGFTPENAATNSRNNIAGYFDLEADISEKWLINVAGRYEDFSDFGDTFIYKIASRYKITDEIYIRAATNSGFRAPSLHQQYFSRTSTVFVENKPSESGFFTNKSQVATLINIPELKEETSHNISGGFTIKQNSISLAIDAYQINIKDRIVLSGSFSDGGNPQLIAAFKVAQATNARFFVNAIDTKSTGIDIVLSHKTKLGENFNIKSDFAATFSKTTVKNIKIPELISNAGLAQDFFNAQEEAFLTLAQPNTKLNLSNAFSIGEWSFLIRNVYFGKVIDPDNFINDSRVDSASIAPDAVYGSKIITDTAITSPLFKRIKLTIGANNIFDIYPDKNRPQSTAGNQFIYSRRTSQFGYSGRFLFAKLHFSL